jgi:hypothetical protein
MTKASLICRTTTQSAAVHRGTGRTDGPLRWPDRVGQRRGRPSPGVISGSTKRLTGHSPPVIDTLLAATALEHDLYLVTRNVGAGDERSADLRSVDGRYGQLSTEPDAPIAPLIENGETAPF